MDWTPSQILPSQKPIPEDQEEKGAPSCPHPSSGEPARSPCLCRGRVGEQVATTGKDSCLQERAGKEKLQAPAVTHEVRTAREQAAQQGVGSLGYPQYSGGIGVLGTPQPEKRQQRDAQRKTACQRKQKASLPSAAEKQFPVLGWSTP